VQYDAYGNIVSESNPTVGDRYKAFGYQFDTATQLYEAGQRIYNAATGTWTTRDPIEFQSGDTNFQRYVGNDPTNATDPTGLAAPWNWRSWQDIPVVNIPVVAYYWGVQFQEWRKGRALDAKLDEVIAERQAKVDIVAAAGDPKGPWNGASGSSVGAGVNGLTNPNFNRNRAQAADDAKMLAEGAVQWNAGAAGFASPSRFAGNVAIRGSTRGGTGQPASGSSIIGQLSRTSSKTPGHAEVAEQLANRLAASGKYERVYLGQSWTTATSGTVRSRNLPDVIGVRKNGKIDAWEVESATDNALALYERLKGKMQELPAAMQGTIKVLRPKGIVKDMRAATNNGRHIGKTAEDAERAFKTQPSTFEVVEWGK
jgi:RHS repeat-associated protein